MSNRMSAIQDAKHVQMRRMLLSSMLQVVDLWQTWDLSPQKQRFHFAPWPSFRVHDKSLNSETTTSSFNLRLFSFIGVFWDEFLVRNKEKFKGVKEEVWDSGTGNSSTCFETYEIYETYVYLSCIGNFWEALMFPSFLIKGSARIPPTPQGLSLYSAKSCWIIPLCGTINRLHVKKPSVSILKVLFPISIISTTTTNTTYHYRDRDRDDDDYP